MERILQSHRFGPHHLDVVEYPDDEGGGLVAVVIDGIMVTDPPLAAVPSTDELMRIYAAWESREPGPREPGPSEPASGPYSD